MQYYSQEKTINENKNILGVKREISGTDYSKIEWIKNIRFAEGLNRDIKLNMFKRLNFSTL